MVEHPHMRLHPALVQPTQHLGRAVAWSATGVRADIELLGGTVEHRLGPSDLRLPNGGRRLDLHDHRMLQIDKINIGIGVNGSGVGRGRVAGRRIDRRDRLGSLGDAPPKAASSSTERYSATARLDVGSRSSTLATPRLRYASATIMLASTANASPPTSLSFMQRATTVSNSLRRRSLSRNRPWRFFENVK